MKCLGGFVTPVVGFFTSSHVVISSTDKSNSESINHPSIYIDYRTNLLFLLPFFFFDTTASTLVCALERRNSLALVLIESGADNLPVAELRLAVRLLLPRQRVLHPVLVVTLREVLAGVCTSRLLAVGGRLGGLDGASQQVAELERLNQVGVPDHAAVLDTDVGKGCVNLVDLLHTLVERLLCAEDGDIALHDLLHGQADLGSRLGAIGGADLVDDRNGVGTGIGLDRVGLLTRAEVVTDGVGNSASEDDEIQERVSTETVGAVDRDGSGLATGEQTRNDLVVALGILCDDLTSVLGGNTTHVVVDSGKDGNGLLGDIDTGENGGSLGDTGQTLVEDLRRQVAELKVDVVLVGANTTALADLKGHGAGHDVAGSKILGSWCVTLHEPFAFGVQEVTTLTTGALSDQTSSAVDTSGVELDELEILVGQTGTSNHSHTITSAGVCGCAAEVGTSVTSSSQNRVLCDEPVDRSVLLVVGNDTLADAILHDQIGGEVLDEVLGVVAKRLSVQGVKKSVAGSVSGSAATVGLSTLAVLLGLTSEGTLVTGKS